MPHSRYICPDCTMFGQTKWRPFKTSNSVLITGNELQDTVKRELKTKYFHASLTFEAVPNSLLRKTGLLTWPLQGGVELTWAYCGLSKWAHRIIKSHDQTRHFQQCSDPVTLAKLKAEISAVFLKPLFQSWPRQTEQASSLPDRSGTHLVGLRACSGLQGIYNIWLYILAAWTTEQLGGNVEAKPKSSWKR